MVGIEDVNTTSLCWDAETSFVLAFPDFKWTAKIKMFVSSYCTDTYMLKNMCVYICVCVCVEGIGKCF